MLTQKHTLHVLELWWTVIHVVILACFFTWQHLVAIPDCCCQQSQPDARITASEKKIQHHCVIGRTLIYLGRLPIGCATSMFVCGGISVVHSRLLLISRMLWSSDRGPEVCRASGLLSHSSSSSHTVADLSCLYYRYIQLPSPHTHPQTSLWEYTITLLHSICVGICTVSALHQLKILKCIKTTF